MYTVKLFLVIMMFGLSVPAFAQYSDLNAWTNLYVEKRLVRGLNLHLEAQGRINENVTNFYYSSLDLGLTFKPVKWLNVSGAYVVSGKEMKEGGVNMRNQYYVSALFKFKKDWLRVNNRVMLQSKNNDSYLADEMIQYRDNYFRDKLSVKVDLTRRLTPYIAQEFYFELNDPSGNDISRSRSFIGIEFLINKRSQVELYHMLQKELNQKRPQNDYVIGIGYEIYLK